MKKEAIMEFPKENTLEPQLYAVTNKYGVIESFTRPGFEEDVEKYHGKYKIEVPEEIKEICEEIKGVGGTALLVGGSVRDAVIGTEYPAKKTTPKDFDLEIFGLRNITIKRLLVEKFGFENVNEVGRDYGITKVKIKGWNELLDIGVPRTESKTGETHKDFDVNTDPSMNISKAALRRDLSINSLAYDPLTKTIYDPFNGVEDIKNKTIRIVNEEKFTEDPLRVMRVMQFSSRLDFTPDKNTINICKDMVENGTLDHLSKERTTEEFYKLLSKGKRPSLGLKFAKETGIIKRYWPEIHKMTNVVQEEKHHPEKYLWNHTLQTVDAGVKIADREKLNPSGKMVLVLSCLCHDLGKPETTKVVNDKTTSYGHESMGKNNTISFLNRFSENRIRKDIKEQVVGLVENHMAPIQLWKNETQKGQNMDSAIRRLAKRLGDKKTNLYMLSLVAEADQRGRNPNSSTPLTRENTDLAWQKWLLEKTEKLTVTKNPAEPLLKGGELINNIKEKPGPWVKEILNKVYSDQLKGNITTKEMALKSAKEYFLESVSTI